MATALAIATAIPASANPVVPTASHTVRDGSARFEVLTPTLIRLEYAADGRFEDAATFNVIDRDLPVPRFHTSVNQGYRVIVTDKLTLRYREGSGPFTASNTSITLGAGPPGDRAPLVAGATGAVRVRHRLPSRGRPDQRR
jgi:hypothetical protein